MNSEMNPEKKKKKKKKQKKKKKKKQKKKKKKKKKKTWNSQINKPHIPNSISLYPFKFRSSSLTNSKFNYSNTWLSLKCPLPPNQSSIMLNKCWWKTESADSFNGRSYECYEYIYIYIYIYDSVYFFVYCFIKAC